MVLPFFHAGGEQPSHREHYAIDPNSHRIDTSKWHAIENVFFWTGKSDFKKAQRKRKPTTDVGHPFLDSDGAKAKLTKSNGGLYSPQTFYIITHKNKLTT